MPTKPKQTPRKSKQPKRPAPRKAPAKKPAPKKAKPKAPPLAAVAKLLADYAPTALGLGVIAAKVRRDKADVARALASLRADGKIAMMGRARAATYRPMTISPPPQPAVPSNLAA